MGILRVGDCYCAHDRRRLFKRRNGHRPVAIRQDIPDLDQADGDVTAQAGILQIHLRQGTAQRQRFPKSTLRSL